VDIHVFRAGCVSLETIFKSLIKISYCNTREILTEFVSEITLGSMTELIKIRAPGPLVSRKYSLINVKTTIISTLLWKAKRLFENLAYKYVCSKQCTISYKTFNHPAGLNRGGGGRGGCLPILLGTDVQLRFSKHPIHILNIFENHTHSYISVENSAPIIFFIILWPVYI
jgi:hypothetical protein